MARQPCPALGGGQRILGVALGLLVVRALGDHVEAADHHGQQVVEIVREAPGQLAERLHLLALPKLLLRGLQLGDVAAFEQQVDDFAVVRAGLAGPTHRGRPSATNSAPS